jgi:hypothetical protein
VQIRNDTSRNPKRFRTAAGCSAKSETIFANRRDFLIYRSAKSETTLPNRRGLQREIFANSRDFLCRSDAPMHSEEHTDSGVLQLYEYFFGVEEAVEPPAQSPFVPNRASADHRRAWAQNHGFTWTNRTIVIKSSRKAGEEPHPCDCAADHPQNAAMRYECAYAPQCTNRPLQDLAENPESGPDLEVFYTEGGKGFGVRAGSDLQAGSLICEYVGEQLDSTQFAKRRKAASSKLSKIYLLKADEVVIDASRRGNVSRFVNHSCSPCAKVQLWTVPSTDGLSVRTAVGIVAKHFIHKGSEITYNYKFETFEDAAETRCLCGAPNCRLFLGRKLV